MSNVVALEPKSAPKVPEFITMSDIDTMSDEELDAMLAAIRVRRMKSFTVYKQTREEKQAVERGKVRDKIEKKCEQIIKDIDAIDARMEKLETHINELRGLRLQAGLSI